MKAERITRVSVSYEDIIELITDKLKREGLNPESNINLNLRTRLVGHGHSERDEVYIDVTIIDCVRL